MQNSALNHQMKAISEWELGELNGYLTAIFDAIPPRKKAQLMDACQRVEIAAKYGVELCRRVADGRLVGGTS